MKNNFFLMLLAVGVGGALGTLARYVINVQTVQLLFPLGTLIENITGSFLLGILTGWVLNSTMNQIVKAGIGVGFCGGFTTMSTLSADFFVLIVKQEFMVSFLYLGISLFCGVALAFGGYFIGEKLSKNYYTKRVGGSE